MRKLLILFGLGLLITVSGISSSCNRGVGCPANENVSVKTNRKGNLPTRRGASQLFPKDMRKKSKR